MVPVPVPVPAAEAGLREDGACDVAGCWKEEAMVLFSATVGCEVVGASGPSNKSSKLVLCVHVHVCVCSVTLYTYMYMHTHRRW